MFLKVSLIAAAAVAGYIIANGRFKLSVELSLFVAGLVAAVTSGNWLPLRHIAEGSTAYIDLALIFFTATLFMNIIKVSGGLDYAVRAIMTRFGKWRAVALIMLMFIMLVPGAITGAGSVSVLVSGGAVAMAMSTMGISRQRIAAIVFILAGLSASPACQRMGDDDLCWHCHPAWASSCLWVYRAGVGDLYSALAGPAPNWPRRRCVVPRRRSDVTAGRTLVPFVVVFAHHRGSCGHSTCRSGPAPVFAIGAAYLLNHRKVNILKVSSDTAQLLPLLSTIIVIG